MPESVTVSGRSHARPAFWLCGLLVLAGTAGAQSPTDPSQTEADEAMPPEQSADAPDAIVDSEAVIRVEGIAENRFNPTHGTVFFVLRGADFPTEIRDVAVLVNEAQVPSPQVSLSRRIVSAGIVMTPGLNEIILRSWDAEGRLMSADALVWAGDRLLVIDVVDLDGQPVDGATVIAQLANQRSVQSTVEAAGGVAQFVNLPLESIAVEARHPDGRSGSLAVPPEVQRAILTLR